MRLDKMQLITKQNAEFIPLYININKTQREDKKWLNSGTD